MLGTAFAAAAGIIVGTRTASEKAPMAGASIAAFRRVKLGKFEVTTVFDGFANVQKVSPIFGQKKSAEEVTTLMRGNYLPGNKMQIGFTPVVVNTGNESVLFDSGHGDGRGRHAVTQPSRFQPQAFQLI